jgi:hypothetical protein
MTTNKLSARLGSKYTFTFRDRWTHEMFHPSNHCPFWATPDSPKPLLASSQNNTVPFSGQHKPTYCENGTTVRTKYYYSSPSPNMTISKLKLTQSKWS